VARAEVRAAPSQTGAAKKPIARASSIKPPNA
jgi:hypothetical protein